MDFCPRFLSKLGHTYHPRYTGGFESLWVFLWLARDKEKVRHGKRPRSRPTLPALPARTSLCPRAASRFPMLVSVDTSSAIRSWRSFGPFNPLVGLEQNQCRLARRRYRSRQNTQSALGASCHATPFAVWGGGESSSRDRQGTRILLFSSPPPPRKLGGGGGAGFADGCNMGLPILCLKPMTS